MERQELAEDYNEAGYPRNSPALVKRVIPALRRLDELLGDWEREYFERSD